jgi:hypothetical protein
MRSSTVEIATRDGVADALSGTQIHPSCCAGVFVDESAESVPSADPIRRVGANGRQVSFWRPTDPALGDRVRLRRPKRCADDFDVWDAQIRTGCKSARSATQLPALDRGRQVVSVHHSLPGHSFSFLVRARDNPCKVVKSSVRFPQLRLSVRRLLAQELDGNAQELFSGAALVNARQLLCVRPAEELRRLETGQASDVLHCDQLEAGLPVPGHASGRVRDGPSLPLTAAVIDTVAQADLLDGLIHDYERAA